MLCLVVPRLVREIANLYKDLFAFGRLSYPLLCAYIAMFILGLDSLCELVRICPWCSSVSTLSRHLQNFDKITMNRAMRRMRWSVLKKVRENPLDWIFVFDTTRNPKRTEGLSGQGKWGDSGGVFQGRNLLVLVAVNTKTGKTLPIDCRPCIKKTENSKDGKSAWELSLDILDEVIALGFPKLPVVFDSWFDCHDFMKKLIGRGLIFVIELKCGRNVKLNTSPKAKKHKLNSIFKEEKKSKIHAGCKELKEVPKGLKGARYVADKVIHLFNKKSGHLCLKVVGVFNFARENNPFACYSTNDLSKSGAWLWQMSRRRWNIEVLFRNLKQNLAWGRLASQGEQGCNLSIIMPLIIVTYLELKNDGYSIGQLIKEERQCTTLRSIDFLSKNHKNGIIEKFKNRLNPSRANQKPVNTVAERKFRLKMQKCA